MSQQELPPPGWYLNESGNYQWWDGSRWGAEAASRPDIARHNANMPSMLKTGLIAIAFFVALALVPLVFGALVAPSSSSTAPSQFATTNDRPTVFENCDEVRLYGAAPIREGDPGFGSHLDRDGDGTGCEPWLEDDEYDEYQYVEDDYHPY